MVSCPHLMQQHESKRKHPQKNHNHKKRWKRPYLRRGIETDDDETEMMGEHASIVPSESYFPTSSVVRKSTLLVFAALTREISNTRR